MYQQAIHFVESPGDISFAITERSGIDSFDLDLGVAVDGDRTNLIPALLDLTDNEGIDAALALEAKTDKLLLPRLLPLPNGRLLTIPLARLQPILAPLLELFAGAELDEKAGTMGLSRRNAGDLALLEVASTGSGLGRQLRDHGGIPPCPAPNGFGATLRAYQEQGLGKTVQTLAQLAVEQVHGRTDLPSLVSCPTSLVPNWKAEGDLGMLFAP